MAGQDGTAGPGEATIAGPGPAETAGDGGLRGIVGRGGGATLHGVVLDLSRPPGDLRILLIDRLGGVALTLGPFPEEDVVATWRSLASASGLTPMMRATTGETEPLAFQLGRLRLGRVHSRRRMPVPGRRRPRFLVRRKSANLPPQPLVYREREIAGGAGA